MFFLNFGFAEFLTIAGAASFATVALYLLDRSRRRQIVSTLRFWTQARQPVQTTRRRRIQQPWSLALQLLGVILLALAIAQPRIGNPFSKPGYHVLIVETSGWMAARNGNGTLMDAARGRARQWLAAVPSNDRVMLVRADALATPATPFEADHQRVAAAIMASQPGATSLDIAAALQFAHRAQALHGVRGEIVFVGTGRVKGPQESATSDGNGLRVMLIPDVIENAGLRRVSARRSAGDPSQWDILVSVRNYSAKPRAVNLTIGFDGAPVGAKRMLLAPEAGQEAVFAWRARGAGLLEARLSPEDDFPEDDRAALWVPAVRTLPVVVYTTRPDILRPFLAAHAGVEVQFRTPDQYRPDDPGLTIVDRFHPSSRPRGDTIWIDPRPGESPVPVVKTVSKPRGLRWITNHPLSAGLREHDAKLGKTSILQPLEGDIRVAEVDDGPIILARAGPHKMVVMGFDPGQAGMRYELSTPLAFANILRWINPEIFRQSDVSVQAAGTVSATLDGEQIGGELQVSRADGRTVPFSVDRQTLHFFSGARENVRVTGQDLESVYSLTLPEMWDAKWTPPPGTIRGLPRGHGSNSPQPEVWPWLAILGAGCLLAEWFVFARVRRAPVKAIPRQSAWRRAS